MTPLDTPEAVERLAEFCEAEARYNDERGCPTTAEGLFDAAAALRAYAQLLRQVAELRKWCESAVPPAHTYASENADLYRGWDNGQKAARQAVAALLDEAKP